MSTNTLTAALKYLDAGFSLFPLAHRSKDPLFKALPKKANGKATWKPFCKEQPTPAQIMDWFEQRPRINLALVMGKVSGSADHLYRAAIDFDDMDAYETWAGLYPHIANNTPTQKTRSGMHVVVETRENIRNWDILFQGQHVGEMRGEGGYIAAWPSIHPQGDAYEWLIPPWDVEPLEILRLDTIGLSRKDAPAPQPVGAAALDALPTAPPQNGRYPLPPRTKKFVQRGEVFGRGVNDELYHAGIQFAAAGYTEQETIDQLLPAAELYYVGTGPGNTKSAALNTIKSGWKGGQGKEPLTWGLGREKPRPKDWPLSRPNGNGQNGQQLGPEVAEAPGPGSPNGQQLRQPAPAAAPKTTPKDNKQQPDDPDIQRHKPRYYLRGQQIIYETYKKVGDNIITVKNEIPFTGRVTHKTILFEDDNTQTVTYTVTGAKDGQPYLLDVEAADFADGKKLYTRLLDYLPGGPPAISNTMIKHVNTAISTITPPDDIDIIKAVPATGWTPAGKAFVMPAGQAVGDDSFVCRFDESIAKEFGKFELRKNTKEDNQAVLDALIELQEVYRLDSLYVCLAHAFLPPLLRWLGTQARYLLHIHAGTGSLKTELAKLLMAFYGPTGEAAITYKWSATPYGAESRAHALKDCLMLLDDLKPNTLTPDVLPRWVAFIQAYVDSQGRKRATIGGRAATALPPRAVLISTGEAIPEAGEASYTARMLLVELDTRPADAPRNPHLDNVRDNIGPLFSGLMRDYIAWLLAGAGDRALDLLRQYQNDNIKAAHARLSANYAANKTAARMFADFLQQAGYWSDVDHKYFITTHDAAIRRVVAATSRKVEDERYSQKFLRALQDALSTGFAKLSGSQADQRRVGWQDGDYVYLLNGSLAIVNQWLRNSGESPLIIPMREVRKQLHDDGYTYTTPARAERGEFDVQRNDPADDSRPMVMAVFRAKFYGLEIGDREKAA